VREGTAGASLVAYLGVGASAAPEVAELRSFLRERLPDYMLPATFVALLALPLLPNGKVDRSALPAPGEGLLGPGAAYVEPATAVERRLAAIWASLLGTERVGLQDDFFELGGHSLLAAQVLFRIQEELAVEISVQSLFENPTVAGLAALVEAAGRTADTGGPQLVAVSRERFRRRLPGQEI
jgi:acyl carrier protein